MLMEGSLWFAFGLVLTTKKSWHLWVCHLAYTYIFQWVHNKVQGLLEVKAWIWNWTHAHCIGRQYLNHWATREVPWHFTPLDNPSEVKSLSHVRLFVILWTAMFFHPWDFPGKSTGVGCHFLLLDNPKVVSKGQPKWKCSKSMNCDNTAKEGDQSNNGAVEEELAGRMLTLLPFERL